jgi:hypothetical protein
MLFLGEGEAVKKGNGKPPEDDRLHRHIAPRLASGDSRVPNVGGLPEHIKNALRLIAVRENQSLSWVMEQLILDYFGFKPPQYIGTRKPTVIEPEKFKSIVKAARPTPTNKEGERALEEHAAKLKGGSK